MAKTRSARGGRNSKKKAAKSARRPKPAKKVKKAARPARKGQKGAKTAKASKAARKKTTKKAARPARRPARPARKAVKKPASAKASAGPSARKAKASAGPARKAKAPARKAAKPAATSAPKKLPNLNRERRRLTEAETDMVPSAPSTLGYEAGASAARSGHSEMRDARVQHTETGPVLTGGDVDANWEDAYAVGDEAPGGDNPTPDQDRVDDIGKALGLQYEDNEELKGAEKIIERDRHRWELDPASSDDYVDRRRDED